MTRDELFEKATRAYFVHATGPEAMKAAINVVLEEAAKVADGDSVEAAGDEYQSDKPGHFWDRESIYGQGRIDAAAAIRALKGKANEYAIHIRFFGRSDMRSHGHGDDVHHCDSNSMNWRQYYMAFAQLAATKSKDTTKVGAILVGPDGEIRLTAYNGPPKGVRDHPARFERPAKYLYASHAEANLVAFAAREGIRTKGCAVYVTHTPCSACARALIQAGITAVWCGDGTTSMPAEEFKAAVEMIDEAGVELWRLNTVNEEWTS